MRDKSNPVKTVRRILLLTMLALGGCQTAHDVAVTSFRVIDAPANFVRRKIDESSTTTTTTTTTTVASDAVTPGRTVHAPPSKQEPPRRQVTTPPAPGPNVSPRPRSATVENPKPSPSAPPRSAANAPAQFPTAKSVPGKPGYVFSPYDPNGGYVDVNGFTSGSKVKDPYSGKIFLVP